MAEEKAKNAVELRLDAAATPERVAAAATMLARMLHAIAPTLASEAVTLVVQNRDTRATMRTWSPTAEKALQRIVRILENPSASVKESRAADLASAIVEEVKPLQLLGPRFYKPRSKRVLASVDAEFIKKMRSIAKHPSARMTRGTTVVYSPVYRVGRFGADSKMKARIDIGGPQPVEVELAKGQAGPFFDAAKTERCLPIKLLAVWVRVDEELVLDHRRTIALDVDLRWGPEAGVTLASELQAATGDSIEDLDEVIARIEGDS